MTLRWCCEAKSTLPRCLVEHGIGYSICLCNCATLASKSFSAALSSAMLCIGDVDVSTPSLMCSLAESLNGFASIVTFPSSLPLVVRVAGASEILALPSKSQLAR